MLSDETDNASDDPEAPQRNLPRHISLKTQIILLTCMAALLSALLVGGINYYRIERIVVETATDKLAGETRLMAQRFKSSYDQLDSDVQVLSKTPPIQGIARSVGNGDIDPLESSSTGLWKTRLASTFQSMMAARPHYLQIRYVGIADQGRELVRVNRQGIGSVVVAEGNLQSKGDEPYFQAGVATVPGSIHFSEVSYNEEFGQVDGTMTPTLRAIKPIYTPEGILFGMIVINAHYADMLQSTFEEIKPKNTTYVINNSGDYVAYNAKNGVARFQHSGNYTEEPPKFIASVADMDSDQLSFQSDDTFYYFVRMTIDPNSSIGFLGVVMRETYAVVLAPVYEARRSSLMWGALLVMFCLGASAIIAHRMTRPLENMAKSVKGMGDAEGLANLPLHRMDEIGELARAFDQRSREIASKESKLVAANEAKLRAIVDNTVDGLITIDGQGIIESFNSACETIFGYSADEAVGQNVKMLMPAPYHSEHDGYLSNYHGTGVRKVIGIGREVEGRRKDGSVFPLDLSVSQVNIGDRKIYSGIVRDISERKHMETMKDEFISTVNHELRTPLTSIQGALGLLMAMADEKLDERKQKLLKLSYDNCQRLSRLVNDILDMEKIAAGKMEYRLEVVEVCQLVAETVERQQSFAEKHDVTFALNFEVPEVHANLDQDRFNQALVNLLSNAAKFSHKGGRVEIGVSVAGDNVVISVRDHGPGIPESFRSKIFGKFAQADGSETRVTGGSGLGLNITKTIIEAFDGAVAYETEVGVGTVFTFALPVYRPERMRA